MAFGGVLRFSDLLNTASSNPRLNEGCIVDTSILFAASYTPDKFNAEAEELFDFLAELNIPAFTNVNVRSEFINDHRRVMIPEGLSDLYSTFGKSLDGVLYAKLQSVYSSLSAARTAGKPYKFDENQIKSWRKILKARRLKDQDGWIQFCADFLQNRIEALWNQTCDELGINFVSLRHEDKSDWLAEDLKWEDMASIVGRFGIGSFDAMIINLFLKSRFSALITADSEMAYVIRNMRPEGKFVFVPDKLEI